MPAIIIPTRLAHTNVNGPPSFSAGVSGGEFRITSPYAKAARPQSASANINGTEKGIAYRLTSGSLQGWKSDFPDSESVTQFGQYTVIAFFYRRSQASSTPVIYAERPNATQIFKLSFKGSPATELTFVTRNAGNTGLINLPSTGVHVNNTGENFVAFVKTSDSLRTVYANGSYADVTTSSGGTYNPSLQTLLYDPQDPAVNNTTDSVYYVATIPAALSIAELHRLNSKPWSLLQRASRILYFPSAGGGGATYDEAVSETLAAVAASSTLADWLGTASESIATTSSQGNTWSGDVAAAMTLAVTTAEAGALETAATVAEAVAIVTAQAQDGAITVTVSETAGIVSTEAATASMAVAVAEAVATVSAQSGIATMAAVVGEAIAVVVDQFFTAASLDAAVSEAIAATTTISATVEIGGLVSEVISALSAESVTSVETATVAFTAGVIDAAIGGMIASGTVSELLSIATSESGSVITAEFRTPDGRTLSVQFDSRTLEVRKQIRTLLVSKSTIH